MRRTAIAGKALADIGLVHHAEHRRALVQQRDQGAPDWKSRDEGFGAVYRIQHPDIFGVLALVAELLADDAVLGKIGLDQAAHHRFRGPVGLGDRIEIARALVVDRERGPEERQDGFAGRRRKTADEGCKIDDRHGCPLPHWRKNTASCLAQSARPRTANGALFPFVLRTGFRIGFRKGFVKRGFLVSPAITSLRVLAYQHCIETVASSAVYIRY